MEKLEINCPVCNKSGLPDYKIVPTICPQCNSDLKGFLLVERALKEKRMTFIKGIFIMISISIVIMVALFFIQPNDRKSRIPDVNKNIDSVAILKDSLFNLQKKTSVEPEKVMFHYVVKKGDNLSKIAYSFYNDWAMYKQIILDNNIKDDAILMPNDTLIINLKIK